MKLVSFQIETPLGDRVRVGAVDTGGQYVDLEYALRGQLIADGLTDAAAERIASALIPSSMVAFIEGGDRSLDAARGALAWAEAQQDFSGRWAPERVKLLPPVPSPPMLRDFMAFETHLTNIFPKLGREIPPAWYEFPVYYKGNPTDLGADGEDIHVPSYEEKLDFEFELGIVIGKGGIDIPKDEALDHIYGLTIYNDFSARVFQSREMTVGLGPAKGKDFQRGHVFGPWLVTMDEIPDIYALRMQARVNGETWCDDTSGSIHWKFEDQIAHASKDERLNPGEILGSGTVGWGSAAERGTALNSGDVVELEVTGLGILHNRVV